MVGVIKGDTRNLDNGAHAEPKLCWPSCVSGSLRAARRVVGYPLYSSKPPCSRTALRSPRTLLQGPQEYLPSCWCPFEVQEQVCNIIARWIILGVWGYQVNYLLTFGVQVPYAILHFYKQFRTETLQTMLIPLYTPSPVAPTKKLTCNNHDKYGHVMENASKQQTSKPSSALLGP